MINTYLRLECRNSFFMGKIFYEIFLSPKIFKTRVYGKQYRKEAINQSTKTKQKLIKQIATAFNIARLDE